MNRRKSSLNDAKLATNRFGDMDLISSLLLRFFYGFT